MPEEKQTILVCGGNGFIGSHCVVELANAGYDVVVADNFINSVEECTRRTEKIVGKKIPLRKVDITKYDELKAVFNEFDIHHVIHFAALKSVGESVSKPLEYYENNLMSLINLLKVMHEVGVKSLVFSSSCTVYGDPKTLPISEAEPMGNCTNPYGRTKFMSEMILEDMKRAHKEWSIVSLRYFNPVGAHSSGEIGEAPVGIPNNLLPYVLQVAAGIRPHVNVFGNDYDTVDGTGVRDYIHVVDLAIGHVAAIKAIQQKGTYKIFNLGTGKGYSVMEVIKALGKAIGREIPYKICPRRDGDIACVFADTTLAEKELGWKATRTMDDICRDAWNWQTKNPNGFTSAK